MNASSVPVLHSFQHQKSIDSISLLQGPKMADFMVGILQYLQPLTLGL